MFTGRVTCSVPFSTSYLSHYSMPSLTILQRRLMAEVWLPSAALKVSGLVYDMTRDVCVPLQTSVRVTDDTG